MDMDLHEQQCIGSEIASQVDSLAQASVDLQFEREHGLRERLHLPLSQGMRAGSMGCFHRS